MHEKCKPKKKLNQKANNNMLAYLYSNTGHSFTFLEVLLTLIEW